MINRCAKFHKDSPSGKKVKLNLARAIELLETLAVIAQIIQSLHANLNSVVNIRNVEKKKTIEKEKMMFFIYSKLSTPSQVHRKPLRLSPAQPNISSVTETAVFVYNFVYKPYASKQLRWHIWPTFPLNFLWNFHRRCLSMSSIPWCKKVKNDLSQS